ncbi:tRNA-dihydrouridine synthase [Patescibacteria group bacterium]|nr:tRNA-dihydrouridine synthase [Patescibacteria group bacterium]
MPEPTLGFWAKLKRPILALAPMANVTDAAFRRMFSELGKPDVFWTEFVSIEGLLSRGREKLLPDLWFGEDEHPIVAQVFSGKPEQFERIGPFIKELGFDGIDINMGCPDSGIERSGAGAELINDPVRAKEIVRAAKLGAGDLPVSIKTRIGYGKNEIERWVPALLEEMPAVLTVHLRTRDEMSQVPAHWDKASLIVELRNEISPKTLIIGNGDAPDAETARRLASESGLDGVMIGRGAFGNPWLFSGRKPDLHERLERLMEHVELFERIYKSDRPDRIKNFDVMKKHFKAYVAGFDEAKELRVKLMETKNAADVRRVVTDFLHR